MAIPREVSNGACFQFDDVMNRVPELSDTNFAVTAEQIARLEQALLSLRESSDGAPEVIEAIAAIHYNHILELRAELDAALGFAEEVADLMISFGGSGIGLGTAPFGVISSTLAKVHYALRNVVGFVLNEEAPTRGRPTQVSTRAADFQFVGVKPGSVRVMLNIRDPHSLLGEFDREPLETAVGHVLRVARWASSNENFGSLRSALNDDGLARILLSQVRHFVPDSHSTIEYVALSGRLAHSQQEVMLTRAAGKRLGDAFSEIKGRHTMSVIESGKLRQVDLDSDLFHLRERPDDQPALRCHIPREILAQALGYLVEDERVTLEGIQKFDSHSRPATLEVTQIYPAEP